MDILFVSSFCLIVNIPFGRWRSKYKKFSLPWWVLIHVPVPFIIILRIMLQTNTKFIPLFIAMAVFGQYVGRKTAKQ